MEYDWPHTRAAWTRLKSGIAFMLVGWAMRLDPREVWLVVFRQQISDSLARSIPLSDMTDSELIDALCKEPTSTQNADGEK